MTQENCSKCTRDKKCFLHSPITKKTYIKRKLPSESMTEIIKEYNNE